MKPSGRLIAAIRAVTTLFFVATSLYCLVMASSFAYYQFISPGLFQWLVWAVSEYRSLFLGAFSLTLLSLLPDLSTRVTRTPALAFAAVCGVVAVALFVHPVLGARGSESRSLLLACAALMPALWLAALDHLACGRMVFRERPATEPSSDSRIFATAAAASVYVWGIHALIGGTGIDTSDWMSAGWLQAVGASLLLHATSFAALAWILVAFANAARATRHPRLVEYCLALGCLGIWLFWLMQRAVLPALALRGIGATAAAAVLAVTIAACWSGVALRVAALDVEQRTALELFFRAITPRGRGRVTLFLTALPAVAYGAFTALAPVDWGFLLQRTTVLLVWLLAWAGMFTLLRSVSAPPRRVAIVCSLLLLGGSHALRRAEVRAADGSAGTSSLQLAIDRYAAFDPSFKLLDDALAARPQTSPSFYQFLSANANVDAAIPIAPARLDFGPPPRRQAKRPDIFLFVVDSLRRDYLSPYNPAVTFTPAIDAFAAESLVFDNAFSRYGGTGLAVPSIFSGSLLPHRQYVLPFAPMNALGRLLEDEHYRFAMSFDSVVTQLSIPPAGTIELSAGRGPNSGDLCETLADLQRSMASSTDVERPLFAYALPQNIHVSYVAAHPEPTARYAGFHAGTAAQLRRLDACFGDFIGFLKSRDLFDSSLIIVTADHGDSLGEGGRWGHGYAGFPEIFRVPLIMHLPADVAPGWTADLTAVTFSTDLGPTIHALLGGETTLRGDMFGAPLVRRQGSAPDQRRHQEYLLVSSYGPVYGLLSQNGRHLYIVDAINARDYAFDLNAGLLGRRVVITAAERQLSQRRIAERVADVSAFFGFDAGGATRSVF